MVGLVGRAIRVRLFSQVSSGMEGGWFFACCSFASWCNLQKPVFGLFDGAAGQAGGIIQNHRKRSTESINGRGTIGFTSHTTTINYFLSRFWRHKGECKEGTKGWHFPSLLKKPEYTLNPFSLADLSGCIHRHVTWHLSEAFRSCPIVRSMIPSGTLGNLPFTNSLCVRCKIHEFYISTNEGKEIPK